MAETARIFKFEASVESIECYKCGVVWWVSASLHGLWLHKGETFYCPNGHGQIYTTSTVARLEEKLVAMKSDCDWWKGATTAEEKRHSATKGQMTNLRRRIGAGTCPCCKRTFKQLAAHMKCKHPEYGKREAKKSTAD